MALAVDSTGRDGRLWRVPIAIDELLMGKAVDLALKGIRGAVRAFGEQDSVGRLLVLLHADFGAEADLGRDAFYSWRKHAQLTDAFEAVIVGELLEADASVQRLADLIVPRLVRTPRDAQPQLARRMAAATFPAAPVVVEGGTPETRLLLAHIDATRTQPHEQKPAGPHSVGFQLPLVVAHFIGRDDELRRSTACWHSPSARLSRRRSPVFAVSAKASSRRATCTPISTTTTSWRGSAPTKAASPICPGSLARCAT